MAEQASLFERLLLHPARAWLPPGAALLLWLLPFGGAALAGDPIALLQSERWRALLVAPTVMLYIIAVSPPIERAWKEMYRNLRPVVLVADEAYAGLIAAAMAINPRHELLAFAGGAGLGLLRVSPTVEGLPTWLDVYLLGSTALLFGLLAWVIYVTVCRSRVTAAILAAPLAVDPNNTGPFMAIGRQALLLALVFIGGITLSLLSSAIEPGVFGQPGFWLVYVPIALAPVAVFFLAMRPTHRVLAGAKARELAAVRAELRRAHDQLLARLAAEGDPGDLPPLITALSALEQRLEVARTWPYNTAMLRTLFVSVLAPGAFLLIRKLIGV